MLLNELIGKKIIDIYIICDQEEIQNAECFIELDNKIIIDIPFGNSKKIWVKDLNPNAFSIFKELTDRTIHLVNKDNKSR